MTNVLIKSEISHVKAGTVGRLLSFEEANNEIAGNLELEDESRIIKFPDGYYCFYENEFEVIDLKPIPSAFKDWLAKKKLINWLKN